MKSKTIAAMLVAVPALAMPVGGAQAAGANNLIIQENSGLLFELKSTGSSGGVQTYAGTGTIGEQGCSDTVWNATATRAQSATGKWTWTFKAINPSFPADGCIEWVAFTATGKGELSGTWTTSAGFGYDWSGTIIKGAGNS